ncbi:MAG: hypothetical protein AAFO99_12495 [Bacteroidota bacterium]
MKRKLLFIFCLITLNAIAQNFSGRVVYELTVIPKAKNLNTDSIIQLNRGKISEYLITDNYYKSTSFQNDKELYSYTYDNISKRMYDNYADKGYITYRDSRKANFEYYGSEIFRDSTITVNGLECFMVKYDSDYGKSTTYYSDKIRVNYETFRDHQVGNWYNKLKEVDGCISLKTITEFETHYEIREAIEITPLNLKPSDFDLNTKKIIVASPYALDKMVEMEPLDQHQIKLYRKLVQKGVEKLPPEENYTSYITFIVFKDGHIDYTDTLHKSENGLDQLGIDIFKQCNFRFEPGVINGVKVSSLVYLPIKFGQ